MQDLHFFDGLVEGESYPCKLRPEGLGRVKADPGQIEQVLMNLAVNALDTLRTSKTIELFMARLKEGKVLKTEVNKAILNHNNTLSDYVAVSSSHIAPQTTGAEESGHHALA